MFERYGVDGIMIGRASSRQTLDIPRYSDIIFQPVRTPAGTFCGRERPTLHCFTWNRSLRFKDGRHAIFEMRRHLSNYFKGLPHFKDMRLKLLTAPEADEIRSLINEIKQKWGDFRTEDRSAVYDI
jgi:tRNA-dihydrouridine synthase B